MRSNVAAVVIGVLIVLLGVLAALTTLALMYKPALFAGVNPLIVLVVFLVVVVVVGAMSSGGLGLLLLLSALGSG